VGSGSYLYLSRGHASSAQAAANAPTEVGVVTLKPQAVALSEEMQGRVSAYRVAEVRARVNGLVLKRHFTEGSDVKAGQLLFQIDSAPYRASLAAAQAQLARAKAAQSLAILEVDRASGLLRSDAISKQQFDGAVATQNVAAADVNAGNAAVDAASINLGYTTVTAPVSGRVGRASVTEGAYVQAAGATLLATIQQIDKVYVDVTQSSVDALRLRRALQEGKLQSAGDDSARVTLILEDGSTYSEPGALQFSDIAVDPSTGSVNLRALFPNPNNVLLPGMFVRTRIDQAVAPQAILVPARAVTRDQKGQPLVMVVGANGTAEVRRFECSRLVNDSWLATAGLNAGEQVIVDGLQKVRPDAFVKATSAQR
jgi:membrane fusion protein (multidrug efflux system)